ncbi:unnamed protein product [Sphagnum troendelagicum]
MCPTVGFLRALHVHFDDEVVLRSEEDGVRVDLLDPDTVVDGLDGRLDNNVELMRCAPDSQHVVVCTRHEAGDDAIMASCHSVLAIRRHTDKLRTSLAVQCVHELGDQIENVHSRMPFEHRQRDEMQVN